MRRKGRGAGMVGRGPEEMASASRVEGARGRGWVDDVAVVRRELWR